MKVVVVDWSHPDGSAGILGVYSSDEKAEQAIFEDRGYCDPYWKCSIASEPSKTCKLHNRPIKEAYGNWSAWVNYYKHEFEVDE